MLSNYLHINALTLYISVNCLYVSALFLVYLSYNLSLFRLSSSNQVLTLFAKCAFSTYIQIIAIRMYVIVTQPFTTCLFSYL